MDKWIAEHLSNCLNFTVPDDLVEYILAIENTKDLEEYLKTLLDFENAKHRLFVNDLLQKKKQLSTSSENASNKSRKKYKQVLSLSKNVEVSESDDKNKEAENKKKKTKFVNLYSQEGQNKQVVLLKGRHHCDCQATKHKLINNCMRCGRIICQQEGSGPCLFCGNLICTPEEQQVLNSSTKKSASLYNKLMEQKRPEGWEAALAQRNRLLEYDRTSEKRTRVTDDDSDYFSNNSVWLSKAEKVKLEKYEQSLRDKKHTSRLNQTFSIDFAGRKLVEESADIEVNEDHIREIMNPSKSYNRNENIADQISNNDYDGNIHPGYVGPPPKFDPTVKSSIKYPTTGDSNFIMIDRIQDAALQEMGDRGFCLSMHQPWASLLVTGIKLHEGRTWYSSHRGRLWIASTVQPPDNDTIRSLENKYTILYPDKKIVFPKSYPTGCLLGCVNIDDCIGEEEYFSRYPGGESESPYVFICSDPHELPLKFPIKGKHKIYALDKNIHLAATKTLQKMSLKPK